MSLTLDAIMQAQALRSVMQLEPIDGPGGHIFPSTYSGGVHAIEKSPDGSLRVLVDSVASQANRQEAALVAEREVGSIDFADIYVDLTETEAAVGKLSATEMPHRLSDAILRDSEIDGLPYTKSGIGKQIIDAKPNDLTAIIETSPTTALYGAWFSGFGVANQLKLQRCVVSEIWAENAVLGVAVGGRSDPLGIERIPLYKAAEGDWTPNEDEAEKDKNGKPVKFGKEGRPSEIKHGQIPPDIHEQGVTAESVILRWALSMPAVRRLRFGGGSKDSAGQAYIAALALLARVLDHEQGYALRSRCDLISRGPVRVDLIDRNGEITTHDVSRDEAIALFRDASDRMVTAGLKVNGKIDAKPSEKLAKLIAANATHQAATDATTDAEATA